MKSEFWEASVVHICSRGGVLFSRAFSAACRQEACVAGVRDLDETMMCTRSEPFFFTLVTGPIRSLNLTLRDTRVYEPQIRARLGTAAHFCKVE